MVKQRLHKCKPSSQLITSSDYSLTFFFRSMARNVESLTWLLGIFAAKIQIVISMIWNTTECLMCEMCLYGSFPDSVMSGNPSPSTTWLTQFLNSFFKHCTFIFYSRAIKRLSLFRKLFALIRSCLPVGSIRTPYGKDIMPLKRRSVICWVKIAWGSC